MADAKPALGEHLYQCLFEIGLCIAQEGGMAVPAVWRLINLLAFIEPKQHAEAHRRDACAPLSKSKSKLLLVLPFEYPSAYHLNHEFSA